MSGTPAPAPQEPAENGPARRPGAEQPLFPARTIIFILVLGGSSALVTFFALKAHGLALSWPFIVLLAYFTLVSGALLVWQEKVMTKDLKGFIHRFMLGLTVKLLGSLVLLFLLMQATPKDALRALVVTFTLLYLTWLAFGTGRLMARLRQMQHPGT